jgi:hypothetical protein
VNLPSSKYYAFIGCVYANCILILQRLLFVALAHVCVFCHGKKMVAVLCSVDAVGDGVPAQQYDGVLLAWPATIKENTGVLTITLGAKFDCDYNDMITFLITWTSPKATAQCSTFGRIGHCGFF